MVGATAAGVTCALHVAWLSVGALPCRAAHNQITCRFHDEVGIKQEVVFTEEGVMWQLVREQT